MAKKKSKLSGRSVRVSSPFENTIHKTEWTAAAKAAEWINGLVKEKGFPFGQAEVEIIQTGTRKRADVSLFESPQSSRTLCVVEFKPPFFDSFAEELKTDAHKKANNRKAKYFATSNFQKLIWFKTEAVNRMAQESEQIAGIYDLSRIEDLDSIEEPRFKNSILKGLERFLFELSEVYTGKKTEPLLPIDELLIYLLHEKIYRLSKHYKGIIRDRFHKEPKFRKQLARWFIEQQWHFTGQEGDFEKAARQTGYLLTNKILFYQVLKSKQTILASLTIPDDLVAGGQLQKLLQSYFDSVIQQIDYETIYSTDFIDEIAFPEHKEIVDDIKEIVEILKRYDISQIGFDTIGRIFERLIPSEERHNLGQYFTSADVVDIILRFCHRKDSDKVIDPSCGAGTFLVRAYQHKKLMNNTMSHQDILETLWGVDIAKFPAHLSMINLAINDLGVLKNYPNIAQNDFFDLMADQEGFHLPEKWRKIITKPLGKKVREITYPRWYDCIVGNPPYTRQEEMSEITGKIGYKDEMINKALHMGRRKLATISKRAGIHAYFFVHGTKFLKNGGRFGFIVSNSWMDVDYGKGLQELFLNNYKIIAIIESKVERWFEDADINTCIIVLEKCNDARERNENLVRFVYLSKPLRHFIPPARDIWEKQKERLHAIDNLIKTILFHDEFYKTDDFRIFPKKQKELWEEGFNKETGKYEGAKWGKYLRAPEIFFKILEKGKDKLVPLKDVADVRFGIKTGANKFFYLTEEEIQAKGIEKEFWMHEDEKNNLIPNYIIRSFRESLSISINRANLKNRILMIHKDKKSLRNKKVFRYIKAGEQREFGGKVPAKTVSCKARGEKWYDLGENAPAHIFYPRRIGDRFLMPFAEKRVFCSDNLFPVKVKNKTHTLYFAAYLNSTVAELFNELSGRNLTGAINVVDMDVWMAKRILVPNFINVENEVLIKIRKGFKALYNRSVKHTLEEVGATSSGEVVLDKVKPDRRALDKIIMGDILGLTDEDQLEVYRTVVDLVKSRIDKAKSVRKKGKFKEGVDIEQVSRVVMDKIGKETYRKFYEEKVLSRKELKVVKLFSSAKKPVISIGLFGCEIVARKERIQCVNEEEARYLKVWLDAGLTEEVKTPTDEKYLKRILPELEELHANISRIISEHLESITSQKLRNQIIHHLQKKLFE